MVLLGKFPFGITQNTDNGAFIKLALSKAFDRFALNRNTELLL
jgi:hypothetical protein